MQEWHTIQYVFTFFVPVLIFDKGFTDHQIDTMPSFHEIAASVFGTTAVVANARPDSALSWAIFVRLLSGTRSMATYVVSVLECWRI